LRDQKPERLFSGPSFTLLGSTNRNTIIGSNALVSPTYKVRPNLFPITTTAEEAYTDSPKPVASY